MKTIRVYMETPYTCINPTEDFEVTDDATEVEIAEEARSVFFNTFNYSYEEVVEEVTD